MEFDLAPPVGVSPLRIGMPRQEADAALDSLRDLSALSDSDRPGQHIVRPSGLMISISCMQGQLEAIELWRSFEADTEPDEEQGHYFSSVLVAQPGYYDTPAEPGERRRQTS